MVYLDFGPSAHTHTQTERKQKNFLFLKSQFSELFAALNKQIGPVTWGNFAEVCVCTRKELESH